MIKSILILLSIYVIIILFIIGIGVLCSNFDDRL